MQLPRFVESVSYSTSKRCPTVDVNGISAAKVDPLSGRLVGLILRSQLLVLLQRRHFCDCTGRPIGRDYSEQQELDMEVR